MIYGVTRPSAGRIHVFGLDGAREGRRIRARCVGRHGGVARYVRLSRGAALAEIPKPYRYRVLIPWLAGRLPVP